jgi:hypothetical protein
MKPPEQTKELTEIHRRDALVFVIARRPGSHILLLLLKIENTFLNGISNNKSRDPDIFRLSGTVRPYY